MNFKSSRKFSGQNPNRRFSQPVFGMPPPSDKGRRGSELNAIPRNNDPLAQAPLSLTPQYEEKLTVDKRERKSSRVKDVSDGPSFDPDHYNPDGSLRTIHKMPSFTAAYAEASKARYIRHPVMPEHEKELGAKQIFDKS